MQSETYSEDSIPISSGAYLDTVSTSGSQFTWCSDWQDFEKC